MRFVSFVVVSLATPAFAQPPQPLPASITGVVTASGTAPARLPAAARFQDMQKFPPETTQAVLGMRSGAEWLARMQQPHGKFLIGLNPAIRQPADGDTDFRQACAAFALTQAARFTGDEKLTACAGQAVLALLTQTKDEGTGKAILVPANKLGFAAMLACAICELPTASAALHQDAEKLCVTLIAAVGADGSVPEDAGFVLQALAMSEKARPATAKREVAMRCLAAQRAKFRAAPTAVLAGTVLPAAVELFAQAPDKDIAATACEMADWLCACQHGKDVRNTLWSGSFGTDPTFESAHAARGLAAACQLAIALKDVARAAKYRAATVEALAFVRNLQFTPDNAEHFEPKFRTHYLIGGVRLAPAEGIVRADATACAVLAFARYLESGAEVRE